MNRLLCPNINTDKMEITVNALPCYLIPREDTHDINPHKALFLLHSCEQAQAIRGIPNGKTSGLVGVPA